MPLNTEDTFTCNLVQYGTSVYMTSFEALAPRPPEGFEPMTEDQQITGGFGGGLGPRFIPNLPSNISETLDFRHKIPELFAIFEG
jgi:hypothetical protein